MISTCLAVKKASHTFLPTSASIIHGLRSLMVTSMRIIAVVSFFAPLLGLKNILSHWKADQMNQVPTPYSDYTVLDLQTGYLTFLSIVMVQFTIILVYHRVFRKKSNTSSFFLRVLLTSCQMLERIGARKNVL